MVGEKQREIDLKYLKYAYTLAQKSPDPSTQNGAIIVMTNSIFSLDVPNLIGKGYTGFPNGVNQTPERQVRPLKYQYVEHAERVAIYDAAFHGNLVREGIMYAPWFACAECGRAIVMSGISEVIGSTWPEKFWNDSRQHGCDSRIDWSKSIEHALAMFDESGVKYRWVDGPIDGIEVLFDGKLRKLI
jgi:dCMP deaminase